MLDCGFYEAQEQGVGMIGTGIEFRVSLGSDEEGMLRDLAHLYNAVIRGVSADIQARIRQSGAVIAVDLVTVAVPFIDQVCTVEGVGTAAHIQLAGIRT